MMDGLDEQGKRASKQAATAASRHGSSSMCFFPTGFVGGFLFWSEQVEATAAHLASNSSFFNQKRKPLSNTWLGGRKDKRRVCGGCFLFFVCVCTCVSRQSSSSTAAASAAAPSSTTVVPTANNNNQEQLVGEQSGNRAKGAKQDPQQAVTYFVRRKMSLFCFCFNSCRVLGSCVCGCGSQGGEERVDSIVSLFDSCFVVVAQSILFF